MQDYRALPDRREAGERHARLPHRLCPGEFELTVDYNWRQSKQVEQGDLPPYRYENQPQRGSWAFAFAPYEVRDRVRDLVVLRVERRS